MKIITKFTTIVALFLSLFSMHVLAVDVIVHPSNADALDQGAIAKIFLGKSTKFPGGSKAVPIALTTGTPACDEFNDKVLGKSSSQLKSYWSKLVFTGKGTPPKEMSTDQDVIDLISANPNMIGYISSGAATDAVKVIGSF